MKVLQTSSVGFQEFRDVVGANFHSCLLPSAQHHQVTIFSLVMECVKLIIPSKQQQKKGNCLTNSQTESHLWSKNCLNRQSASWRACLTSVSSFRNEALEWFVNLYAVHWLVLKYMQQIWPEANVSHLDKTHKEKCVLCVALHPEIVVLVNDVNLVSSFMMLHADVKSLVLYYSAMMDIQEVTMLGPVGKTWVQASQELWRRGSHVLGQYGAPRSGPDLDEPHVCYPSCHSALQQA